jgi:hypothetical protein
VQTSSKPSSRRCWRATNSRLPADGDIIINGTGLWHIPGPESDAGLTGPQDRRRHLRRLCPRRRRRLQRQGPEQGRPQRRLRCPLHCQEHRRGRLATKCEVGLAYVIGQPPADADHRYIRYIHRQRRRAVCLQGQADRHQREGDHRQARPGAADLRRDQRLWALRQGGLPWERIEASA